MWGDNMVGFFRNWIIQILVTVIFLIIVDMILPENNFKKYAKLASGLIIVIVLLSPIMKFFNNTINVEDEIGKYISSFNEVEAKIDYEAIGKENNKNTIEVFKEKLIDAMENSIYKKTGEKISVVKLKINEDTKSYNFSEVEYLEIAKKKDGGKVKAVDKVIIGKKEKDQVFETAHKDIIEVLSSEFNVKPDTIKFVK